uniref:ATP synthase subunit a n=1 Tax=Lentinula edodes TaxID=5353 RepID=I7HDR7_LENED|nr:ATP synthase A chain subunit 6 [Lentinula edodes]ARI44241.1 ATP synthase F0 subunit a [Lentinula edodes]QEN73886.1 ATP synthase A chain subunit 6 [Lentinula edodes]QEN73914.1 ATP synthase A chain subunit 6 [Lentinula edodes]UZS77527.1 ATP synthase A chain subunit 6 [Lentinula edodes]UZS77553.1 ATP synthase A chain subunit 6 [Lentinula edodes]
MHSEYIFSPLSQFEVLSLIGFNAPILNYLNLSLTNLGLYTILALCTIVGLHTYGDNEFKLIPNKWSIAFESSFQSLSTMVRDQIGSLNEVYIPFIYSIFFFVLIGNLISNVPYSFAINASVIVTLGLSVTIFMGVTILSLSKHKLKFFSYFIPSGTPLALVPLIVLIEVVSYFARAVSLGVRLFANITAGHTLLKILSTFLYKLFSSSLIIAVLTLIPFAIFLGIVGLEIAVSLIQSFVLTLLTCSYLKDAIDLH